jgi:hypothetical protein
MSLIKIAIAEGIQAVPPVAISAMTLHDNLDDMVLALTAIYLLLQIAFMVRKHKAVTRVKADIEDVDPLDIRKD